jgi:hypothetical protein
MQTHHCLSTYANASLPLPLPVRGLKYGNLVRIEYKLQQQLKSFNGATFYFEDAGEGKEGLL